MQQIIRFRRALALFTGTLLSFSSMLFGPLSSADSVGLGQLPPNSILSQNPPADLIPIVIIIDDIGYNLRQGRAAVALPGAITLAVLPHSPHGAKLAEAGHAAGKEIMFHAPMSNVLGKANEEATLTRDMDRLALVAAVADGLQSVPHAKGVNNHMGSLLTQDVRAMQWLMAELKNRRMFFVDSRTSAQSRALEVARRYGLVSGKRDFFLDNVRDAASIRTQLQGFLAAAKRRGGGVAIGHPYLATLEVLAEALPELRAQGFQLLPASRFLILRGALESRSQARNRSSVTSRSPIDKNRRPVERLQPR